MPIRFFPTFGPQVEGGQVQVRGVVIQAGSNTCSYSGLRSYSIDRDC